jgi:hypothetical protein
MPGSFNSQRYVQQCAYEIGVLEDPIGNLAFQRCKIDPASLEDLVKKTVEAGYGHVSRFIYFVLKKYGFVLILKSKQHTQN